MKKSVKRTLAVILGTLLLASLGVTAAFAAGAGRSSDSEQEQAQTAVDREEVRNAERGRRDRPEEPAEPENAIGKEAAKNIALSDAGIAADQVSRIRAIIWDNDGTVIYKVRFTCDGIRYSYRIDPLTGEILNKHSEEASESSHPGDRGERPEEPAEPENAIGKEAAKNIALSDAGIAADQVNKVRAMVCDKDGTVVYKVRFTCDGQRYSYRIDPLTGEILSRTVEEVSENAASHGHCRGQNRANGDNSGECRGSAPTV